MTYLNDDFEGGKTTFNHYDLDVKPVTGRTMIWPVRMDTCPSRSNYY